MHRIICIFIVLLIGTRPGWSQNLVINGSFEDVNICDEYHAPCSPSAWFFQNKTGAQGYSREGELGDKEQNRFLSLLVARQGSSTRQYWETMLLRPLHAGYRYKIKFRYFAEEGYASLKEMGLYFTNDFIFTWDDSLMQPGDHVAFDDAKTRKGRNGWVSVEKEITAQADARILIAGNFSSTHNVDILRRHPGTQVRKLLMLVDDLSVEPIGTREDVSATTVIDSLYALTRRHYIAPPVVKRVTPDMLKRPVIVDDLEPKVDTIRLTNIEFDFDQYKLKNTAILDPYRRILLRQGIQKVIVIGYTDTRGSDDYNKELSYKRSKEIAGLLTGKFNISASLIEAEGRGKSVQFADDAKNRRVEIYVYY